VEFAQNLQWYIGCLEEWTTKNGGTDYLGLLQNELFMRLKAQDIIEVSQ
jgi:hypothetical protein